MNTLKPVSEVVNEAVDQFDLSYQTVIALIQEDRTHTKEVLIERLRDLRKKDKCEGKERKDCRWCSRDMYCWDREEENAHNEDIDQVIAFVEDVYKSE